MNKKFIQKKKIYVCHLKKKFYLIILKPFASILHFLFD